MRPFGIRPLLFLLIGGAFFATNLRAAERFLVRTWQSEDGLPSNVIRSIAQAADGYLWVATAEGVVRFDGVRFSGFDSEPDATLSRRPTRTLFPLPNGDVWVTTHAGALLRGRGARLTEVRLDAASVEPPSGAAGIVSQVAPGDAGEIFIVRGSETWLIAGNHPPRLIQRSPEVETLLAADAEATASHGRWRAGGAPLQLHETDGTIWRFGGGSGLEIGTSDGAFEPVKLRGAEPPKATNEMLEDREGSVWLATAAQGLWQLREARVDVLTTADGLSGRTVLLVMEDRAGGLWIATTTGGLDRLEAGEFTHVEVGPTSGRPVSALCETRDGTMWAATREGSIFRLTDGVFTPMFTAASGISKVFAIVEDAAGRVWFGGRLGLSVWDGEEAHGIDLGTSDAVTVLATGKADEIWVGTESGLVFHGAESRFKEIGGSDAFAHRAISSLLPDSANSAWAGTLGGGLFHIEEDRAVALDTAASVQPSRITCILDDLSGHLWLGSLRGIFRLGKSELGDVAQRKRDRISALHLDRSDGLLTRECTGGVQPAGWRSRDGTLWFPTTNGLANIQPAQLNLNPLAPSVVIEEMRSNARQLDISGPQPTLGPGRSRLEFRFTALSLVAPSKVRFRTRLDGLEDEWSEAGAQRTVAYEAVPPGRYAFRVQAENGDGIWNESGATLAFRVLPHFWQTLAFQVSVATAAAALAVGIGASISRVKMRGRLLRLELKRSREAERARIAQDLHDDLGASLTEISILANLAAEDRRPSDTNDNALPEIAGKAQALVGALDEIVWAVNPRHDTLGSLAEYLTAFASEFLSAAGITLRLDVPHDLPASALDAERRHSIFLAVREALNNAVKHSGASEVWLRVRLVNERLEILVEDNGRGFAPKPASGDGVGNLQSRLARLSGECKIESREDCGTRVRLSLPLKI